jgi:hypothetical protein
MAERVGFEPTRAFTLPVFKTGAVNRLATSPHNKIRQLERISGRMVPATLAWYPANPENGPETLTGFG